MLKAVKLFYRNYFSFKGRTSRKEWLLVLIGITLLTAPLCALIAAKGGFRIDPNTGMPDFRGWQFILFDVWYFFNLIPAFALHVRRLHDVGKSGWFLLIFLVPFVGELILFVNLLTEGNLGVNRFGDDPRAEESRLRGSSGVFHEISMK